MTTPEARLTRHLATLTAVALLGPGCGYVAQDTDTGTPTPDDTADTTDTDTPGGTFEGMCAGDPGPADYLLYLGYVTVEPGTACPAAEDAQLQVDGCTFIDWTGVTCGFDHVDTNQVFVNDGYGGYYTDADAVPTGYTGYVEGDPVDVCYYQGVYYDDPDHSTTCGRPLLQGGEAVLAGVREGPRDWAHELAAVDGLTAGERADVAAWWLEAARMEHASIASFSVCAIDLMRLGAPPELLASTHRAALDEIVHARLCFELAGRYRGQPLGPAPMTELRPEAAPDRVAFAEALFREGCVGETLAAVDAATRLALARDPAVRRALETIVRDESEHAALAWRTLRWVLDQDADGAVRARLEVVLAEERARWTAPTETCDGPSPAAVAHGLLPAGVRSRELARAFAEVVEPSWAGLA